MSKLEDTTATLTVTNGDHKFDFSVYRDNIGFVVFLKQTTNISDIEGCEDMENFKCTYKCVCHHSKSEHSAIHFTGAKYINNWNKKGRIGKDVMIINQDKHSTD